MLRLLTVIGLIAALASAALAEEIIFTFSGHVTSTNKPSVFPLTQIVTGTYTFESTTPDGNTGNPEQGDFLNAVGTFSFTTGSYSALANDGGNIIVNRNNTFDPHMYDVSLGRDLFFSDPWGPEVDGEQLWRMRIRLVDANMLAITSIALPLTPPNLDDFTTREFGLIFEYDATNAPGVVFTLDALEMPTTAVEPSTWGSIKDLYSE